MGRRACASGLDVFPPGLDCVALQEEEQQRPGVGHGIVLRSMTQPGEPGEGERTSLGRRTRQHRAIPEERPSDLPRSAATSGGCGGLCPPAAWDTTTLDVRHEPVLCPCWRSACHAPGSHPPASVWLFRTSTCVHGGGRLPRVGRTPRGRRRRPYRPAVPKTGATAGEASRAPGVPGQAWPAAPARWPVAVQALEERPAPAWPWAGARPRPARAGECAW
jgi:hypothetical protein